VGPVGADERAETERDVRWCRDGLRGRGPRNRASGHSNVGHHDINAVPFGVSVSSCVTSHSDT